jgi:hypothetical protein
LLWQYPNDFINWTKHTQNVYWTIWTWPTNKTYIGQHELDPQIKEITAVPTYKWLVRVGSNIGHMVAHTDVHIIRVFLQ